MIFKKGSDPITPSRIRAGIITLFFAILLIFSYTRLSPIANGVKIVVNDIKNGETFRDSRLNLSGNALNAVSLTINNSPVPVDQKGNFSESLLLPRGLYIITLRAQDKFGKIAEKEYQIYRE